MTAQGDNNVGSSDRGQGAVMRFSTHPRPLRWLAFLVFAVTLAALTTAAQAAARSPVKPATPPAAAGSPADTGATDISNLGSSGWEVQSSAVATQTGAQISMPGFST